MKYLSVCSGIEAASVAWHPLGWEPVAFSEIEPFQSAVLAARFPNVPNLGDMTKYAQWEVPAFDLLVGGTPCQAFSDAGFRKGLADPRGNLALVYLGILDRFRPRWCIWENVPGVLSSNGGRDFGSLLGGLGELGYGFAYRVLDSQYVRVESHPRAVPQRRRRVFLVGHSGGWRRAAEVLLETDGVHENSPPRRGEQPQPLPRSATDAAGRGDAAREYPPVIGFITRMLCKLGEVSEPLVSTTLLTGSGNMSPYVSHPETVNGVTKTRVRRLTPTECVRLQGFPDGHTLIDYGGKPYSDELRYKALGNSMAVNVMRFLGERIAQSESRLIPR